MPDVGQSGQAINFNRRLKKTRSTFLTACSGGLASRLSFGPAAMTDQAALLIDVEDAAKADSKQLTT